MPNASDIEAARVAAARRRVVAYHDAAGLARVDFAGLVERRGPVAVGEAQAAALADAHGRLLALEAALAELARRALARLADGGTTAWRDVATLADAATADGPAIARAIAARTARNGTRVPVSPEVVAEREAFHVEASLVAAEMTEAEGRPPFAERVAAEVARRRAALADVGTA